MTARMPSLPGDLTRLGFSDPRRADTLLRDRSLAPLIKDRERVETDGLAVSLSRVADPDQALVSGDTTFVAAHGDRDVLAINGDIVDKWAQGVPAVAIAADKPLNLLVVVTNDRE